MNKPTLQTREGSQLKRTWKPTLAVSAVATVITALATWGKVVMIAGFAVATPWLLLIVAICTFALVNGLIWGRDKVVDNRAQQSAVQELEDLGEVRRIERPTEPPDAPFDRTAPQPA